VEEAALPLVEGAAVEVVVRRAVIVGVVRHCSSSDRRSGRGALVDWGR
jgi:hypothetical protein